MSALRAAFKTRTLSYEPGYLAAVIGLVFAVNWATSRFGVEHVAHRVIMFACIIVGAANFATVDYFDADGEVRGWEPIVPLLSALGLMAIGVWQLW